MRAGWGGAEEEDDDDGAEVEIEDPPAACSGIS